MHECFLYTHNHFNSLLAHHCDVLLNHFSYRIWLFIKLKFSKMKMWPTTTLKNVVFCIAGNVNQISYNNKISGSIVYCLNIHSAVTVIDIDLASMLIHLHLFSFRIAFLFLSFQKNWKSTLLTSCYFFVFYLFIGNLMYNDRNIFLQFI